MHGCSEKRLDGNAVLNVQRFRGGLVFKAHRLVYHSTLGLRVIKKKKKRKDLGVTLPTTQKTIADNAEDHTVGLCLGPYGGPGGGAVSYE